MRVLVTGGLGFIGTCVVQCLVAAGHDVRILDSLRPDVHKAASAPHRTDAEVLVADLRDAAAVDRALGGVEAVVHLAAKVGLGVDAADLPDYAGSNDLGTAELLAGMARAGTPHLTLASSMVVYGEGLGRCPEHGCVRPGARSAQALRAGTFEAPCPVCGRPLGPLLVAEDAPIDPRNAYASSKFAQEMYAGNWARLTGGTLAVLRYHNVYGPGLPRDTPYAGVAALFLSALRRGVAPRVFEDGGQRRDFVHVADVAAATVAATVAAPPAQSTVRAFNIGSGVVRTVGELATALAAAVGGPQPVVTGQFRLGDVRHITADSTRARTELRWRPQVDFGTGMAELAGVTELRPLPAAGR